MELQFEWDPAKARANERKHGVSFGEASTVFRDAYALHVHDGAHAWDEERFIIIGMSARERVLMVVYVERTEMTLPLVSARPAQLRERRSYEEKSR
ncbi:MAG TPA: BrnT family toxin [Thermoanaerobaculia bacterium]|jgi:uncharacterized DUF497 family protein|nr:BrnT family toxin [Thermoanaerobaculia bacterium]